MSAAHRARLSVAEGGDHIHTLLCLRSHVHSEESALAGGVGHWRHGDAIQQHELSVFSHRSAGLGWRGRVMGRLAEAEASAHWERELP